MLLRLIGKWLNAGVLEEGQWSCPETGSPQGGVISPLLANTYLHYVLDDWFVQEVQPRLQGRSFLIRYADDFVMGFACEADARRVPEVLPKRFGKYGLTMHPDKTRLVPFTRPGGTSPGTFDFLGFTHYWGKSRSGSWVVKRKTAASRFRRTLAALTDWCQRTMHRPIREQHAKLSQKLHGPYGYYGVTGNYRCLADLHYWVTRIWRKRLSRRSWRSYFSWARFRELWARFPLPPPRVVHSAYRRAALR